MSETKVAVDFLGLGTRPNDGQEEEVGNWPKPVDSEKKQPVSDNKVGGGALSPEKCFLDKPLEDLTETDILQLTREDCRRYLKEKGMRRPSWNKSQAMQQVLSLKGLFDQKNAEKKEEGSSLSADDNTASLENETLNNGHEQQAPGDRPEGLPKTRTATFCNQNVHLSLSTPAAREPVSSPNLSSMCNGFPFSDFMQADTKPNLEQLQRMQGAYSQGILKSRLMACHGPLKSPVVHTMSKPFGSQLTIFYSGMVNVYDDVSAEKAHAIMRLAGNGTLPSKTILPMPLPNRTPISAATPPEGAHPICFSSAELPQARKASLQRFLEKRKERLRQKAPYPAEKQLTEASNEMSPSPSVCTSTLIQHCSTIPESCDTETCCSSKLSGAFKHVNGDDIGVTDMVPRNEQDAISVLKECSDKERKTYMVPESSSMEV